MIVRQMDKFHIEMYLQQVASLNMPSDPNK